MYIWGDKVTRQSAMAQDISKACFMSAENFEQMGQVIIDANGFDTPSVNASAPGFVIVFE
jgi:hypothetical protein